MLKLETTAGNVTGTVRDFRWVPFALSVPRGGVWPCQLFIQSPVKNGRWVIHIHIIAPYAKRFIIYNIYNLCHIYRSVFHLKTARFPPANCTEWPDICTQVRTSSRSFPRNVLLVINISG